MNSSQTELAAKQFGSQAKNYVTSSVHALGDDLRRLAEIVAASPNSRVLDLGCGGGHVAFTVAPHAREVIAYDVSQAMLDAVAHEDAQNGLGNLVTCCGIAEELPFEDASFDFVFSRYSAHHWYDLEAGVQEARRVLRLDGRAVFIDVASPGYPLLDTHLQALELLRDPSHVRDYTHAEWMASLARAGFSTRSLTSYRLRLEFASWIARMHTPEAQAKAIRSMQGGMPSEVVRYFKLEKDGSFTVDTMLLECTPV